MEVLKVESKTKNLRQKRNPIRRNLQKDRLRRSRRSRIFPQRLPLQQPQIKKRSKQNEFPRINWSNNSDPDIQMCIILYDERINKYRRMQDISILLDTEPSAEFCIEIVECDILQRQAHNELCSYNERHCFLGAHPLVQERSQILQLENSLKELKRKNPVAFFQEISNITQNIRRIESNIQDKKI